LSKRLVKNKDSDVSVHSVGDEEKKAYNINGATTFSKLTFSITIKNATLSIKAISIITLRKMKLRLMSQC
jgi:hypothetical protein